MGSRHPKVLCRVLFKPMITWVSDWCRKAGIRDVCVVVGKGAGEVRAVLPKEFVTAEQTERRGTGHAVMMARDFLKEHGGDDVLVLCGDAPFVDDEVITASLQEHRKSGSAVTIVTAQVEEPFGYGRILRENGRLAAIVEERDASASQRAIREINSGTYWFRGEFLLEVLQRLDCANAQGEYYLTDSVAIARQMGLPAAAFLWDDPAVALGANDRHGLLKLNREANRRVIDKHLRNGVNFYSTDGVVLSPDAQIGPDATIGPGTILKGKVIIGAGASLEGGCIVEESVIGEDCVILSSVVTGSRLGDRVRLGPYSQLRPGTVLADEVKVGDFVEVKNSTVGEKTSVAHLSYIGDTDIGCHVNVGCGFATANFDGVRKHRSIVEDFAFIGCHTSLVSPVRVGKGAYTAAGTVVTRDVEENALAVSRTRQTNVKDWAENFRQKNGWEEYFRKKNRKP